MSVRKSLLLTLLLSYQASADDWPMYLRDLSHSSVNASETILSIKNIAALEPSWTYAAGASVGSAVTLSSGILYLGDWNGNLHAIEAQRGTQLRKTFEGPDALRPCRSQAVVSGNIVYGGGGDAAV